MGDMNREAMRRDLMHNVNTHHCICEYLRLAYDEVHTLPDGPVKDALTERLIDCLIMGKKMQDKLIYYYKTYEPQRRKGVGLKPMAGAAERLAKRRTRIL